MILSIIVLSHRRPQLLAQCLDSLNRQVMACDLLEIIVVDDGPTPETERVVEAFQLTSRFKVHYCRQAHSGISAARNRGIRTAQGQFVAIVADDYLLPPEYSQQAIDYLSEPANSEVIRFAIEAASADFGSRVSHLYYHSSLLRRLSECTSQGGRQNALTRGYSVDCHYRGTSHTLEAAGGAIMRREVFQTVGEFDENLGRCEDTEFTNRLRRLGMSVFYDGSLAIFHQYRTDMRDTLRKCYETGMFRRKLERGSSGELKVRAGAWVVRQKDRILILFELFTRARHAKSSIEGLIALPFLFLFELVNKMGYCRELWTEFRERSRRAKTVHGGRE